MDRSFSVNDDGDRRLNGAVGIVDDQHGYYDENNDDEVDDNEDGKYECNYQYDSDEDEDEEEDDDEDDEGEQDNDRVIDDHPLRIAIHRNESLDIIFPLIEAYMKTVQQEQKDKKCGELLHLACSHCQSSVVMKFIKLFPKSVKQKDDNGDYPLHIACRCYQYDVVMTLIELFPMAVQHQNRDTYYPLHLACIHGRSEQVVMKLLGIFPIAATHNVLTRSAMVKQKGNTGYALHMACRYVQSIAVIRKLIEINRMALCGKDRKGNYPLHCAIYGDQFADVNQWIDLINLLMEEDPIAILRLNSKGDSPIHTAYRRNNRRFIEDLIEEDDALVNMRNRYGKTLLHYAASYWDNYNFIKDEIIEKLLRHPCIGVNAKDNNNNTPLHVAVMTQDVTIVRKLLDH